MWSSLRRDSQVPYHTSSMECRTFIDRLRNYASTKIQYSDYIWSERNDKPASQSIFTDLLHSFFFSFSSSYNVQPIDFIEIKSVTYCGKSDASSLTMENVPWHHECCQFSEAIANRYTLTVPNVLRLFLYIDRVMLSACQECDYSWSHCITVIVPFRTVRSCAVSSFFDLIIICFSILLFFTYYSFYWISLGWPREGTVLDTP